MFIEELTVALSPRVTRESRAHAVVARSCTRSGGRRDSPGCACSAHLHMSDQSPFRYDTISMLPSLLHPYTRSTKVIGTWRGWRARVGGEGEG